MKKAKRVGDRLVHEVPDWGTPPPPPVEDEVVPCTDHPGRENHCVSGQCGACWLCTTKLGPQVRLGAEHPWVPEDAPDPAPDPAPFVPAPGWKDGVFGPATLASWARVHEEPLLRWDPEEREEWRQAKERGRPSLLERALERIGRARAGEGIHYHGVTGPIGPFAPGGPLDLMPPTPEELRPMTHFTVSDDGIDQNVELGTYAEVSDGLLEALRNCDRATPRIAYRRHPNPELCPMDCPDCD